MRARQFSRRVRIMAAAVVIIAVTFLLPSLLDKSFNTSLKSAEYYFRSTVSTVSLGQDFPVELRTKTNGTAINALGFTLKFNPLYLEVVRMTTDKSFCTFYLANTFNNKVGSVTVSCGTPKPGFVGDALAVGLTFRAKLPGTPKITMDPAHTELLANDGKGSNISKASPELALTIRQF